MTPNLPKGIEIIGSADIPDKYKELVITLLEKYGVDWFEIIHSEPNRKGSGVNYQSVDIDFSADSEIASLINEINEILKDKAGTNFGEDVDLPGFLDFVEQIEFIDWDDELYDETDFKKEILRIWRDIRIDFYRTVEKSKNEFAREQSEVEVESIDIGALRSACQNCGVIFYDNLGRHNGITINYCSISCQERANLDCVQCGNSFIVGKSKALERIKKLEGFCSITCIDNFRDDRENDQHYISSMRQLADKHKAEFDPTITRREIYKRGNGICAICNAPTVLEKGEEYNPYLATVDHIIPWTRGGKHIWSNVQLCCLRCNIKKGNRINV